MSWAILVAGFVGGAIRGLVGFIKYQFSYKDVKFDLMYFCAMTLISGVIGSIIAYTFNKDAIFSLIIGYAGGDIIENTYKTLKNISPSKLKNIK